MKLGFMDRFWKNAQLSSFMKLRPVVFQAGGQKTDGHTERHNEGNIHFSQFFESA
jgi:hypothetical protein